MSERVPGRAYPGPDQPRQLPKVAVPRRVPAPRPASPLAFATGSSIAPTAGARTETGHQPKSKLGSRSAGPRLGRDAGGRSGREQHPPGTVGGGVEQRVRRAAQR
jgi:hypothetical protein